MSMSTGLPPRLQDTHHLGKRPLCVRKVAKRQSGDNNIKAAIEKRQLRSLAMQDGHIVKSCSLGFRFFRRTAWQMSYPGK